jgi:hypothetical protein
MSTTVPSGPFWNEFTCATSNKKYYYNRISKETVWEGGSPPANEKAGAPRKKTGRVTKISFVGQGQGQSTSPAQIKAPETQVKASQPVPRKKTGVFAKPSPPILDGSTSGTTLEPSSDSSQPKPIKTLLRQESGAQKDLFNDLKTIIFVVKIQSMYRKRLAIMTVDLVQLDHSRTLRLFKFRLDYHLRAHWPNIGPDVAVGLFFDEFDMEDTGVIDSLDLGAVANCVGCQLSHREQQEVAQEVTHKKAGNCQDISKDDFVLWYLYMDGAHAEDHFVSTSSITFSAIFRFLL